MSQLGRFWRVSIEWVTSGWLADCICKSRIWIKCVNILIMLFMWSFICCAGFARLALMVVHWVRFGGNVWDCASNDKMHNKIFNKNGKKYTAELYHLRGVVQKHLNLLLHQTQRRRLKRNPQHHQQHPQSETNQSAHQTLPRIPPWRLRTKLPGKWSTIKMSEHQNDILELIHSKSANTLRKTKDEKQLLQTKQKIGL